MLQVLVTIAGLGLGFSGARVIRRPSGTASAASVARSLGGAVGTRRDLDLARLQRSVFSEMMRHVTARDGRTAVPATYRVRLHPDDHATTAQAPGFFTQGLELAMAAAGRQHGWMVPARLRIELSVDPLRRRGAPAVDADPAPLPQANAPSPTRAAPSPSPPLAAPAAPARLERRDDGGQMTYELRDDTVTIGRGTDQTIRVDDTRASRRHATLRHRGDTWTLTDEGSSNGTRLDGDRIETGRPTVLHDGHEIGVGPVTFVFRAPPAGPARPDRTRSNIADPAALVLDEHQRLSISSDFFPADPSAGRRP